MLIIRRVHGRSMEPHLKPGDIVVASRLFGHLKENDIVIIRHNGMEKIKRITRVENRKLYVKGDNTVASTDSRQFGPVDKRHVIAKLWFCYSRSKRL